MSSPLSSYESCVAELTGGKLVPELSPECQKVLGVVQTILQRRNSQTWNSKSGHDSRAYSSTVATGGSAVDKVQADEPSVSEIFLNSKSAEEQIAIKQKIARTASKGGKVRSDDVVSAADVEKERAKLASEKAAAKESHPKY